MQAVLTAKNILWICYLLVITRFVQITVLPTHWWHVSTFCPQDPLIIYSVLTDM